MNLFIAALTFEFWLPLGISVISLIFAGVALWISHLSPFKTEVTFNNPTFRLYVFNPPKSTKKGEFYSRHIPSIDMEVSYINTGSKPGKVIDMRFLLEKQGGEIHKFKARWIVDYRSFNKSRNARFTWLEESIQSDWHPVFVLPRQSIAQHIVFEGMSDELKTGDYKVKFQIKADDNSGWTELHSWTFTINDWVFSELENGSSFTLPIDFHNPENTLEED